MAAKIFFDFTDGINVPPIPANEEMATREWWCKVMDLVLIDQLGWEKVDEDTSQHFRLYKPSAAGTSGNMYALVSPAWAKEKLGWVAAPNAGYAGFVGVESGSSLATAQNLWPAYDPTGRNTPQWLPLIYHYGVNAGDRTHLSACGDGRFVVLGLGTSSQSNRAPTSYLPDVRAAVVLGDMRPISANVRTHPVMSPTNTSASYWSSPHYLNTGRDLNPSSSGSAATSRTARGELRLTPAALATYTLAFGRLNWADGSQWFSPIYVASEGSVISVIPGVYEAMTGAQPVRGAKERNITGLPGKELQYLGSFGASGSDPANLWVDATLNWD